MSEKSNNAMPSHKFVQFSEVSNSHDQFLFCLVSKSLNQSLSVHLVISLLFACWLPISSIICCHLSLHVAPILSSIEVI
eukprot:g7598.t1